MGYKDQQNLYAYVGNDPVNHFDPNGRRSYIVARRIFTQSQARAAGQAAAAAVFASGGGAGAATAAYAAAYKATLEIKHSFLVVTEGDTTIQEGKIEGTYSYGPENANRSLKAPFGQTTPQGPGTATAKDDATALASITSGKPADGVSFQEIEGVSNSEAQRIFSAPSESRPYNPVPATVPGTTNSNSEAFARGQAAATAGGSTFKPPSGILPGASQADRVVCPDGKGGDIC